MLKFKIAKLEDVEEKHRELYEARDGAFFLKAEGAVDKAKLDEFRNNNVELKRQVDELTAKFAGLDIEELKALKKQADDLKAKKLIDSGKVEELLEEKTKAMRTDYEAKIKTLTDAHAAASAQLETLLVDNGIQTAAVKAGVKKTAVEDVLLRGRQMYKVKDGRAVPVDKDGKIIYGKDGTNPMPMEEWLSGLSASAGHLFEPSTGGGAKPGAAGAPGAKTMDRKSFEALDPAGKMAFTTTEKGIITD